mgnify:FL=1|tara:strand:- start:373 stop:534 length:162 start_codon:yes stop_codon:yes gene_type:complete
MEIKKTKEILEKIETLLKKAEFIPKKKIALEKGLLKRIRDSLVRAIDFLEKDK